jgi:hypothetical protein
MMRIAVIFLFACTLGAMMGGTLTHHFLQDDVVLAGNVSSKAPAVSSSKGKGLMVQAALKVPRHLAMLATRKGSHHGTADIVPAGIEDDLSDDITVAPRSLKLMIAERHLARMALSGS